jgi:hypothetical protein
VQVIRDAMRLQMGIMICRNMKKINFHSVSGASALVTFILYYFLCCS